MSGWAYSRLITHEQHSWEETPRLWRAISDILSALTGAGIDPETSYVDRVSTSGSIPAKMHKRQIFDD